MQNTQDIHVDGVQYASTKYPATRGLKLLTRLAKTIGKPFAMLTSGKTSLKDILDQNIESDIIGKVIEALTSELDENLVTSLVDEILSTTEIVVDGKRRQIIFDTDFAGKYGHLFKLLKEVLAFQYGPFSGGLAEIGDALRQGAPRVQAR